MWYYSAPDLVVFGEDALGHLEHIEGERALIVTDKVLVQLGIVEHIMTWLTKAGFETEIFADVEPEPSLQTVRRGAEEASKFAPDWIIAVGGGSPMDAAKGILALYEYPQLEPVDINPLETLPISKAKLMAIPTTSGTGSEATYALVLTDLEAKRKFSTGNRALIPSVAVIDPLLTRQLPARVTADTGLDALTHAVEGYSSQWSNVFSDGHCLSAARLIFTYLQRAYENGSEDAEAREAMANAATLAGLGFANANLALAHAMGHSLGALFHIPHGRAVALFLPYTVEFSANVGSGRYADIVRFVGFSDTRDEARAGAILVEEIRRLASAVEQPATIAALGIELNDFQAGLSTLCQHAEQDTQFFTAPRIPDEEELRKIFEYAYTGLPIDF